MKNIYAVIFKIIIILIITQLAINGSSCQKKRNKSAVSQSSSNPGYLINAPLNLSANLIPPSQAGLSWTDNSNNEDGFEVWRSVNNGSYSLLLTLTADTTSYSDTGLAPSSVYYYRVCAFNTIGDRSAYSNEAFITTPGEWSLISAGADHVVALKINGSIWGWGRNEWFQLGLGNTGNKKIPYLLAVETDWQKISAGYYHTISLKIDGTLWGWGANYYGQLGFGTTDYDGDFPYQIGSETNWNLTASGGFHTLACKISGTLWSTGANDKGQLGLGDTNIRASLTQIGTLSDWLAVSPAGTNLSTISAGYEYSTALKTNNTIWSWGNNNAGQLGLGHTNNKNSPCAIGTNSDWTNASLGDSHTIASKSNGQLWAWGNNAYGQLGLGDNENRYTPSLINSDSDWQIIAAGGFHTLARKTNNSLWSWGKNSKGQLGLGNSSNKNTPYQIGTESDWSTICAGGYHSVALKMNNSLWVWGENNWYQLGLGDTDNKNAPTQSGINLSVPPSSPTSLSSILISYGRIGLYWADNANNEAGFKIERKNDVAGSWDQIASVATNIISWSDVTITGLTRCFYRIKAFNDFGESDYSNETFVILSGGWINISSGYYHTIALRSNNTLWSWGSNSNGQLALATTAKRLTPTQIGTYSAWSVVATGGYHSFSIRTDYTLWSWGFNDKGQLGIGNTTDKNTPVQIGTDSDWISITGGSAHSLGLKTDNSLWSWGNNSWGQLGIGLSGSTNNRLTPSQIGTSTDWVPQGGISAGYDHSIGLKTDRTIWTWGDNTYGQLGLGFSGSSYNRTTPCKLGSLSDWITISAGGYHSIGRKSDLTLRSWGLNNYGQLGLGNTTPRYTPSQIGTDSDWQIIASYYTHSLGIRNNTLWAWGQNGDGQLGLSDNANRSTPSQINESTDWSIIETGMYHSICLKTDGVIWSWGDNQYGQLGLGDSTDRNSPVLNNY